MPNSTMSAAVLASEAIEAEAEPSSLLLARFPGRAMLGDRRIERGLAALIWLSLPFLLHLMRVHPGGYGKLLGEYPEYFFLAAVAALLAVFGLFVLTRTFVSYGYDKSPLQSLTHRVMMTSIVSAFSVTVILLSLSFLLAEKLQSGQTENHAIDSISLLLRSLDLKGDQYEIVASAAHALVAALLINLGVSALAQWLKTKPVQTSYASARNSGKAVVAKAPEPLLAFVVPFAWLTLIVILWLTTLSSGWLLSWAQR
ncbi:hypothetical protein [Bradyrhizobium guangdongense]|uniref:hypothetical protein n=1 Tax=Bradyrhizobium guangdongense TaxID=1325090 RepID=UPI001127E8E7|nr:hypothetical protein [Bradyrhizobium guangdongense]